ncbi:ParB family protein [Arthrobacter oryzae]|uniref:ParB family protein n=1 Tax=Arthrobacter oryzae TaxID=409290 RepID=UPI003CC91EC0
MNSPACCAFAFDGGARGARVCALDRWDADIRGIARKISHINSPQISDRNCADRRAWAGVERNNTPCGGCWRGQARGWWSAFPTLCSSCAEQVHNSLLRRVAPERKNAGSQRLETFSTYFPQTDGEQVRAAFLAAGRLEGYASITELIEAATMREVKRLQRKHHQGKPQACCAGESGPWRNSTTGKRTPKPWRSHNGLGAGARATTPEKCGPKSEEDR